VAEKKASAKRTRAQKLAGITLHHFWLFCVCVCLIDTPAYIVSDTLQMQEKARKTEAPRDNSSRHGPLMLFIDASPSRRILPISVMAF
jgi:hypothetical protein